jgi:DHA1 family bicyclomycin/chloramphenicol resistance-like MFS transporter
MKRARNLLVANLIAQLAFGLLAMTLCLPSMQEWGDIFQASQSTVQLTFSLYVLAYGGFQLVYGPMSDRYGRKPILLIGLVTLFVGATIAAFANSLETLLLGRFIQGAGGAAGMVVGRSMVQDLFHGPERTKVMAYVGMSLGCVPPLASITGGQIHVHLGWHANFYLLMLLASLLTWWAWRALPAPQPIANDPSIETITFWGAYKRLLQSPIFIRYLIILAVTTATFYTFLGGAPLVLKSYGVGPEGVGFYIMTIPLSYFVGNYITSRFIHGFGERIISQWGQLFTLSGIAIMLSLALVGVHTPLAFSLPLIFLGFGHGLLVPPTLSGTVAVIPALAGSAAGFAGVVQQITGGVGGYLIGFLSNDNAVNLGSMMMGFALCGLISHMSLRRLKP